MNLVDGFVFGVGVAAAFGIVLTVCVGGLMVLGYTLQRRLQKKAENLLDKAVELQVPR